MSWETIAWRPADASTPEGVGALLDLVPMLRSALDEAASGLVMGPVTVSAVDVATVASVDLPDGFSPLVAFELLGTARRTIRVAAEPDAGTTLAGATVEPGALGLALAEGLDGALAVIVGEGLNLGPAADEPEAAVDLVLFRLGLTDAEGNLATIVFAAEASVPVELATHVVALQALGIDTTPARARPVATPPRAAEAAPAAASIETAPFAPIASIAAEGQALASPGSLPPLPANVQLHVLSELPASSPAGGSQSIEMLLGVNLQVTVEIGRAKLTIRDILALTPGSIVELDKLAGERVDILVNGHQIASGEVVVVDDNFAARVTDVVSRQRRILSADGAA